MAGAASTNSDGGLPGLGRPRGVPGDRAPHVKGQMVRTVVIRRVSFSLLAVGVVLLLACWWLLQLSRCAGDLKEGTGDIDAALALEGRAFLASAVGMLAITSAISVGTAKVASWLRVLVCLSSFPLACVALLALELFAGHAFWVCAH